MRARLTARGRGGWVKVPQMTHAQRLVFGQSRHVLDDSVQPFGERRHRLAGKLRPTAGHAGGEAQTVLRPRCYRAADDDDQTDAEHQRKHADRGEQADAAGDSRQHRRRQPGAQRPARQMCQTGQHAALGSGQCRSKHELRRAIGRE